MIDRKRPPSYKACAFNRGVMVISPANWRRAELTETVEKWMESYKSAKGILYKDGLASPPFQMAANNRCGARVSRRLLAKTHPIS